MSKETDGQARVSSNPAREAGDAERPRTLRIVAITALAMSPFALAISTQIYLSMLDHGHSFIRIFAWQLSIWSLWALAAPWIIRTSGRAWTASFHKAIPWLAASALALIVVHCVVTAQFTVWFQPYVPMERYDYLQALSRQSLSLLGTDLLIFALLVIAGGVTAARRRAHTLAVRESKLEASLARAQLEALRLEIHPHFLFNTLNSIAALIRSRDHDGALDMLLQLSELLRGTVDRPAGALTTLESETDFLMRYVSLQRRRFGDRLEVVLDVPAECRALEVPTFLLQPLVENALRHGVAKVMRACRIDVRARLSSRGELHVWVSDDGRGLPAGFDLERDAGTGLSNARSRLEQIYGGAAGITVRENAAGAGTTVELVLPLSQARAVSGAA